MIDQKEKNFKALAQL